MTKKTKTKTVWQNTLPESRRLLRADSKKSIYLSLQSREPERKLRLYVSRVKGDGLIMSLSGGFISQNEWYRGYSYSSQEKTFFLGAFLFL